MKKYETSESYDDNAMAMAEEMQRELAETEADEGDGQQPMDDAEVQSIVASEIEDAITYIDSDLSPYRAQATRY
jgi:hypothetical protein